MQTRTFLLLCGLLAAGLAAACLFAPAPGAAPPGTRPGPVPPPVPASPVRSDLPGQLTITSVPAGAAVWIDTDPAPSATTPAVLVLSPITHPVLLRHPGYRDFVTSVRVPAGSAVALAVQMEPVPPGPG